MEISVQIERCPSQCPFLNPWGKAISHTHARSARLGDSGLATSKVASAKALSTCLHSLNIFVLLRLVTVEFRGLCIFLRRCAVLAHPVGGVHCGLDLIERPGHGSKRQHANCEA